MKKIFLPLVIAAMLSACTSITKVEGEQTVNTKMSVKVNDAWNKVSLPGNHQPFEMWTQEGVTLDHLRFWAGVQSGQPLLVRPNNAVPTGQKAPRVPTYESGLQLDQLVSLFEVLYSADGSIVTMTKVEPSLFAGEKGVRFEFSFLRKGDDVQLNGVGWVSQKNGELFAATFVAPKLAFFDRLRPRAESIVSTAKIRS